jgi:uncharacterized protein (DUF488 family)
VRTLYTIGHSTRTLEELIGLLRENGVETLADVRLIPRSRKWPHFNDESLGRELPKAGIEYVPMRSLGGRRRPAKDSVNSGWHNESFRGYADYMQSAAFESALRQLIETAAAHPTAIMCAEAVPWRCHRSLISDAMLVRGWEVLDIMGPEKATPHKLTTFANVSGETITYPAPVEPDLFTR